MKKCCFVLVFIFGFIWWFVHGEVFRAVAQDVETLTFMVNPGDTVSSLSDRLDDEGVIRSGLFFSLYTKWKKVDRKIQAGEFTVQAPVTLARVVETLATPQFRVEREITILPGWTLRDVANYFEQEEIATAKDVYTLTGEPAKTYALSATSLGNDFAIVDDKPRTISLEGYLSPNTFRVFSDATLEEMLLKLLSHRDGQFTGQMYTDITNAGRTPFEVLTVASLVEKEVRSAKDRRLVADLFWRRLDGGWPLQADSSVHFIVGGNGSVFTTAKERDIDSPWNTYKYPGLPKGPISTPSLDAIMATIYPEKNDYWYFLTTLDTGEVKYGRTLDEHNRNVATYLR